MARLPGAYLRLWLGTLAAAGVVVSHGIAYWIHAPAPRARAELLQATGHRYWTLVVAAALALLVFGLSAFVVRLLSGGGDLPRQGPMLAAIVPRLAAIQCFGFVALEFGERVLASGPEAPSMWSIVDEPIVAVGLAIQCLVALAGAFLLHWLSRGVVRLVRLLRRRCPGNRRVPSMCPERGAPLRPRVAISVAGPRGPPTALRPAHS
jgi:hypothetical protein